MRFNSEFYIFLSLFTNKDFLLQSIWGLIYNLVMSWLLGRKPATFAFTYGETTAEPELTEKENLGEYLLLMEVVLQ